MKTIVPFFSMLLILFLLGCSEQKTETITDPNTKLEMPQVKNVTPDMKVVHNDWDGMDHGNKYQLMAKELVVDPKYYQTNQLNRGDVVSIKENIPGHDDILRVVGLPNEKVKIDKGQIYIDGKRLDTFYGKYQHAGMDMEQYLVWRKQTNQPMDQGKTEEEVREYHENADNMNETKLTENQVFVVGDDWFRGGKFIISKDEIIGKVLGIKQTDVK